ncbi:hypothetical protein P3S68_025991 [Capsicum galapagoense]
MNEFRMSQRIVRQILLVLCLLLSYNEVQGEKKLSKLEDAKLEKKLKLLNKPAVKIVKTKYGDIYNCVDFYKQHAFDHPLLKHHNFHPKMKPTVPSRIKRNPYASAMSRLPTIWSKDRGCPSGTVPVKRITKDDLIRQRDMPLPEPINFKDQVGNNNSEPIGRSYTTSYGYKRAILQTLEDPNAKFSGAGMAPNLFNPHVEGKQHSGCRIRILRGSDSMQVGWRVDPTLYGDNKTRLFIHFQTGNTHCFNTLCPGFVHVNTDFTLDMPFDTLSQPGGPSWEVPMYLYRDHGTGNWWLLIGPDFASIGFWPHKIFTLLKSYASTVQWGGVVYSPPGVPGPPMGASLFPSGDATKDAYCRSMTVSNEEGDSVGIVEAIRRTDNYFDYEILFKRIEVGSDSFTYGLYGGPGSSS